MSLPAAVSPAAFDPQLVAEPSLPMLLFDTKLAISMSGDAAAATAAVFGMPERGASRAATWGGQTMRPDEPEDASLKTPPHS